MANMGDKRFSQRSYRSIRSLSVDSYASHENNDDPTIALDSSYASARKRLYTEANGIFMYENPVYTGVADTYVHSTTDAVATIELASNMRLKDFLASIPSFSDFSDVQLSILERKATVRQYNNDSVIFYQGEAGDYFYIIQSGSVDIYITDALSQLPDQLGTVVNHLTEGCYFGDRALMTSEPRAASVKTTSPTTCILFSRPVFEDIICNSSALLGNDANDTIDLSKDLETRSLYKHIEKIQQIATTAAAAATTASSTTKLKNILYDLTTAFSPELSMNEVISRMVMSVRLAVKGDRVGLFIATEDRSSMVLKISERSKGIVLPLRGLAGYIITNNAAINIPDAYNDSRFDNTMDKRTGYRTRQILGVPVLHPLSKQCIGALQINNRADNSHTPFTEAELTILSLAAEQLSELLYHREDVILDTPTNEIITTSSLATPFQIEINSFTFLQLASNYKYLTITASLHLALNSLCASRTTTVPLPAAQSIATTVPLSTRLVFDISTRDLPRATRILFQVYGSKKQPVTSNGRRNSSSSATPIPIGWAAAPIFDFKGALETTLTLHLFEGVNSVPINTTLSNANNSSSPSLTIILGADIVLAYAKTTIYHSLPMRDGPIQALVTEFTPNIQSELQRLLLLSFNPLSNQLLTTSDKQFLWDIRYSILEQSQLLPAFLMSVPWSQAEAVVEVYELLELWEPPSASHALQLLDRRFMDPKVRAFAVHCLEALDDTTLSLYMLQLCQQLKYENYVDSALSRFLLRRALSDTHTIGHMFFWLLQSEVYNVDVKSRYIVLLQIYLRHCGQHRIDLGHQMFVMKRLESVAEKVVRGVSKSDRLEILRKELKTTVLPHEFQLPLNPSLRVKGIVIDKCRVMESKKKPLWLTLTNAAATTKNDNNIVLMLKVGDDLRQDTLILQLLTVMNHIWLKEGLDMKMQLYGCISTGFERGLLQVVQNSTTIGRILIDATAKKKHSGSISRKLSSAMKALNDFSHIRDWLYEQIVIEGIDEQFREEEFNRRAENFLISTAAYCVASYVLGLGDRHNDNLMMTKLGHFFHIDFGHILGNFKYKLGVKRERAPFVFTYAMKAVLSDAQYSDFVELCVDVYNILREHSQLLVSLVSLAIPCGLPELQTEKDVLWLYEKLNVDLSDEEAGDHFRSQLHVALNTKGTRINDAAHMLVHG